MATGDIRKFIDMIKDQDGPGSGLDADLLRGFSPSTTAQPNVIPVTNDTGKIPNEFVESSADLSQYEVDEATVSAADMYENSSGTHTITNYDANCHYEIVSHDALIESITIENNTIHITVGDITDDQDHPVSYTLRVTKEGYLYNDTTVNFTIKLLNMTTDDAIIIEDANYTEDNFDTIYNGEIVS